MAVGREDDAGDAADEQQDDEGQCDPSAADGDLTLAARGTGGGDRR